MGYSGHAYMVIDVAISIGLNTIAYFEFEKASLNPFNLEFLGREQDFADQEFLNDKIIFPAVGNNHIRRKLISEIENENWNQTVLADKSSIISSKANVDLSSLIGVKAVVNSLAKVGKGVIINTGSIVEHECVIGDFSHIAPGAILTGGVRVGEMSFIGAGSVVKNGISIGNNVVIGAGSVVLHDVPNNETWVGNPAKKIK
ncbi:NeuD/PglB/VioB family sugar acetyltransferase [Marivirga harenae]|uniref:NeuD/PglB/VioB family sugar acetyltransferase n=1 Tax=Marivirga harenae TaxID=2010992 RepID=UPI0026E0FFA5|nr:NeuD/PglB/VioB family sugar acetyltransferase [Marivirga harenae]WKV11360.1 NeuD/PglB/VioB family sugar acetyltransferase [Marivirga harenae]